MHGEDDDLNVPQVLDASCSLGVKEHNSQMVNDVVNLSLGAVI
jgi:hypothetical protein